MARRRYLIAYDIREPKRLRRVCRAMEEYGERIQYSVYLSDLSRSELIAARYAVERQMDLAVDTVIIVDLGELNEARITFVGQRRKLPAPGAKVL